MKLPFWHRACMPEEIARGVRFLAVEGEAVAPNGPASSNSAKMYFSVLYAMLTVHRQRREVLAGQRAAEGREPGVVPLRPGLRPYCTQPQPLG
jgi:hypothetical protein